MSVHDPASMSVRDLVVDRAGKRVLHRANLSIGHRARMAVVGPNGVGKSTLLLALAGRLPVISGAVTVHPPSARIGLLDQELERSDELTGRGLVARRVGVAEAQAEFEAATNSLASWSTDGGEPAAAERYDRALSAWETAGGFDLDRRLETTAAELGLEPEALDRPTATLSGGQLTKLGLASIMVSRFDVTLLDEPTNNLDRRGLDLLGRWLDGQDGPVVIVSHDRAFLERTITSVARITANGFDPVAGNVEVFTGRWQHYEEQLALARRRAEERYERYVEERGRLQKLAQQKREWAERGVSRVKKRPADNDRNRRMYELDQAANKIGAAAKVRERADRLEVVERPWQPWQLQFTITEAGRGSNEMVVAEGLVLERGRFRLGPVDLSIHWGDRVLIEGPNGSGKTTLVDGLLGRLEPMAGSVTVGPSVVPGVVGQLRSALETDSSLLDVFVDRSGLDATESRSLLAKFGLDTEAVARAAGTLSPGQRTRAELALFQAVGVNLIVLDEPTNHLDMEAIEQLEQALAGYQGTLLVVTHDQRFRDALAVDRVVDVTDFAA